MEKEDDISAVSLLNLLGVITGIKDQTILLPDTPAGVFSPVGVFNMDPDNTPYKPNQTWLDAGVIDPTDGFLKFKPSELSHVFEHFKMLRLNRRAQKREFQSQYKGTAKDRSLSEFDFHPTINSYSNKLAEKSRMRMSYRSPDGKADIVKILLHPKDNSKLEQIKKIQEFKETEELTLRPKTLRKTNNRLLSARERSQFSTEKG